MDLPDVQTWSGPPTVEDLARLPGVAAVYLLQDSAAAPIQLASTQHLRHALQQRLLPDAPKAVRADLATITRGVRWRGVSHAFEARWWYWRIVRRLHPDSYRERISFGPAWFLNLDESRAGPELRVSEHIWRRAGACVGPFPTQPAALEALDLLRDLFDLCRYPEELRRAPHGKRCAYADMGRCDAPCDGAVPLAAYAQRVSDAWTFAGGAQDAWIADATLRMQRAAAELRFESAALLKRQREAAQRWRATWSRRVRPQDQMRWLLALPVVRRKAWKLLLFDRGSIQDGPLLAERKIRSGAAWVAEALARQTPADDADTRCEQTWLVAHFLYSNAAETAGVFDLSGGTPAEVEAWLATLRRRPAPRITGTTELDSDAGSAVLDDTAPPSADDSNRQHP